MNIENKDLKRRIIDISYQKGLSHLGSCLTAVDIIKEIYDFKRPDEPFILSSGHAGLALYTVLEARGGRDATAVFDHHGVHPDRCSDCLLDCSTGSLGQGLPIAVGMALADRGKKVWCLISDGECSEGSIAEALRIATQEELENLEIYLNFNGYAAYKTTNDVPVLGLEHAGINVRRTNVEQLPFLSGLDAHYKVMSEADYKQALEFLK